MTRPERLLCQCSGCQLDRFGAELARTAPPPDLTAEHHARMLATVRAAMPAPRVCSDRSPVAVSVFRPSAEGV